MLVLFKRYLTERRILQLVRARSVAQCRKAFSRFKRSEPRAVLTLIHLDVHGKYSGCTYTIAGMRYATEARPEMSAPPECVPEWV